jgi:hypothetical protein
MAQQPWTFDRYTHCTDAAKVCDPPTKADILLYNGRANTVVVYLVNQTPYDIELPPDTEQPKGGPQSIVDKNRKNPKSGFFAPLGVPALIHGVNPRAITDKNYVNTETYPAPMVFAWSDNDVLVKTAAFNG